MPVKRVVLRTQTFLGSYRYTMCLYVLLVIDESRPAVRHDRRIDQVDRIGVVRSHELVVRANDEGEHHPAQKAAPVPGHVNVWQHLADRKV
jgi:hypothetical protein